MRLNKALNEALPVLHLLEEHGYVAVFVGGCVRDTMMGRELKDVDIATSAEPQQVMALFPRHVPTGLAHGTITVMTGNGVYEITTFRKESAYEQFRRPAEVQFVTDLEADLLRRDFTINAMAMRGNGQLVDPFGGLNDLRHGTLRCVGEADARFQEDALRMVRAIRFAAEFRLRFEMGTWNALIRHRALLQHVAMERIGAEADKMISGSHPHRAAALFAASGLLHHTKVPLPQTLLILSGEKEASTPLPEPRHNQVMAMKELEKLSETDTRWTSLCLALGLTSEDAFQLAEALKFSNVRKAALAATVRIGNLMGIELDHALDGNRSEEQLRQLWLDTVIREGIGNASTWLTAVRTIPQLLAPEEERSFEIIAAEGLVVKLGQWLSDMPIRSLRELAIGGADAVRLLQRPEGPWLGQLLQGLLRAVIHGHVRNDRESLLAFMKENESELEKT
ncbi:CCA tRNA nucleotidyltransferase [Paenibacillus mendelii]|uniref:CCA tRNA nucleotidyltransferase n=1 Tax=Paenibacillus mendelii TaxID=206163 RepID=A0ABV6JGR4_9BACL|nr:CCA tRNA nucleotidyltransferase [Paenibacillus mendelii]MCQ6558000.1 CCA tRNA nucleotidyltransferase [Paenibacillus mendelii]